MVLNGRTWGFNILCRLEPHCGDEETLQLIHLSASSAGGQFHLTVANVFLAVAGVGIIVGHDQLLGGSQVNGFVGSWKVGERNVGFEGFLAEKIEVAFVAREVLVRFWREDGSLFVCVKKF